MNRFADDFRPQSAPPVLTYPDHSPPQPDNSNTKEDYLASYEYYCHWQQNKHNPRLAPPTVDWRVNYEQEMRLRTVNYQSPFPGPLSSRRPDFDYPNEPLSSDGVGRDAIHSHPMDRIQNSVRIQDFPRTPSPPIDVRRIVGDEHPGGGRHLNGPSQKQAPEQPPKRAGILKPLPPHRDLQQSAPNLNTNSTPQQPPHPMGHPPAPFPLPARLASDQSTSSFSASFNQYGDLPMSPLTPQRSLSDGSMSPMFPSPMHMAARPGPHSPIVPYMSPAMMNSDAVQQPVMPGYPPNSVEHMPDQFRPTPFYDPSFNPMDQTNMGYDRRGMPMRAVLGEPPMYPSNHMAPTDGPFNEPPVPYDRFGMESHGYHPQQFGSETTSMGMSEGQNGEAGYSTSTGSGGPSQTRGGVGTRGGSMASSMGGRSGGGGSKHNTHTNGGPRMGGMGGQQQSRDWDYNDNHRSQSHRRRGGRRFTSHRDGGNSDFDARQLMRGNVTLQELIAQERVVSLACDQNGSRFIQTCLEKASDDEKQAVFEQIYPETLRLCADVFGNYVIQKFFEYGSERHKMDLASCLMGRVLPLSLSMYGCRVIQKALECVNESMRVTLVQELMGHVEQCVRDQNGNHVIQKCIEEVPNEHLGFICSTFVGKVFEFSTHPYGCRVIQRLLEHSTRNDELIENEHTPEHRRILQEILQHIVPLSKDQYGNYVVQHVLEHGPSNARDRIVSMVLGHVLPLSKHKFASNVVEKAFMHAKREDQREALLDELIGTEDNSPLPTMVRDQYANYVIQTVLGTLGGPQRSKLIRRMNEFVPNLRKFIYGKHIVNKIEQLTGRKM